MRFSVFYIVFLFIDYSKCYQSDEQDEWTELINWYRDLKEAESEYEDSESEDPDAGVRGYEYLEGIEDSVANEMEGDWWSERKPRNENDANSLWNSLVGGRGHQQFGLSRVAAKTLEEEEVAMRGASLAFVFDSTGSMGDELNHVKSGAMKILAALRDHPDAPIYNYIWVPFNDPGIGPITVTRDPKLFEQRMSDVVATGGGDCPEMSLGAIRKALENCLPNSYVYVFTDAPPKDSNLLNDVLSLIQRKQAQVVFIVTDGCLDTEKENYWVYERIAHTSSGQIYKLTTDEVKEVLKYVKVALQPHIVSLVSLNKPAPNKSRPDRVNVVIDDSLQQFTVSVSGINAKIDVSDPKGFQIQGPPRLEKVLNLANIKVVNVKKPDPGAWSVVIESDSDYTVRSTGLSKVNFNHGFSTKETINIKETNYRPLKGAKSFVLIQTSDTDEVFNITTLDFVALTGEILASVDLDEVEGSRGLYKAGSFVPPPDEFFHLGVTGFGRDGFPIKRITSTAISAQLPEKPVVTMRAKATGKINRSGRINCRIESVVPVTVRWYKNGKYLEKEQTCRETCEVFYQINKIIPETEGKYLCEAKNLAGTDAKELSLTITGEPPSVSVISPVVVSLGRRVLLNCLVDSPFSYTVTWAQFTATDHHSGILHPTSAGVQLENNSLVIDPVKAEDEGWYICVVKNKAGESQGRVLLVIKEPVNVRVEPDSVDFSKGDSARVVCSAAGKPSPAIEWQKNQQPINDPTVVLEEVKGNLILVIHYLEEKHAGVYTCNADNSEESATASVIFTYKEIPKIKAVENNLMVKDGAEAILRCEATGVPEPVIKWYKEGRELNDKNGRFEITAGSFVIKSSDAADFGEYSCVAENEEGTSVDHIGLTVGSKPTFLQKPRTREIQLNHSGTIACSAFGVPIPEIKWSRSDGKEMNESRMTVLPTGALKITKMSYEDGGRYICKAENIFGSISHEVSVKVSGIVVPALDNATEITEVKAIAGSELTIPCGIHLGNPPATVKWLKDGSRIGEESDGFTVKNSGGLVIANASVQHGGSYICVAENVVGQSSRSIDVFISEGPTIAPANETLLKSRIGGEVIISCSVSGYPLPTLTWTKNGLPLPTSSTMFQEENGSLIMKNLSEESSGTYACTATNAVGSVSKETILEVQVPPSFTDELDDYPVNVVEGHMVVLNCNASGTPEPSVRWYKNDEPFSSENDDSLILRFFATIDHTGIFKCVVVNEAGSSIREFNVTILVPPKILGRQNDKSIKAKTGFPVKLTCNVTGTPTPMILWQRNGMYLTQNTTDALLTDDGSLVIANVTKDSAGAYTCDAENLGGITQRTYYLQVNYQPRIVNLRNDTTHIILKEGESYSLDCLVEGNPRPNVIWKKNGLPIHDQQTDLSIIEDNTLVFLQASREMTGSYRCEAVNSEGIAFKEHKLTVIVPPSFESDFHPTKLEVNEGDSLALTCPTILSVPPPNIQWIKDGNSLDPYLQERSDEAQMKLSFDQKTLTIVEAHPTDRGNYSCVATNAAGRTDAKFFVDVLMTPHFEEFNHVAHRTILTGGEVVLNCSVSGNPTPKVVWRKGNTSITPHNTPGVYVTLDRKHLKIVDGRVDHTGTYVCLATNKVNTKEREFYVTVLEPPQVSGSLQQTLEVMKGDDVTLDCQSTGSPQPAVTWIKKNPDKKPLNFTGDVLKITNASCEDSGMYICKITNAAGIRTRYFDVTVLETPAIKSVGVDDQINGVLGKNITLKCKTTGNPKPETTWLHNGRIFKRKKRFIRSLSDPNDFVTLELTNLTNEDGGTYTLLAFNAAGVVEKKFQVQVLVPPTFVTGHESGNESISVIHAFPVILKCRIWGDPVPRISWFHGNDKSRQIYSDDDFVVSRNELLIKRAVTERAGTYVCLAENSGGHLSYSTDVRVIEPPRFHGNVNQFRDVQVNDSLKLYCNISGSDDVTYSWSFSLGPTWNDSNIIISMDGKTLLIEKVQKNHSGIHKCKGSNKAGSAEMNFHVTVNENFIPNDQPAQPLRKTVSLHLPFTLYCLTPGNPPPSKGIRWYKDGKRFEGNKKSGSPIFGDFYLRFPAAKLEDDGNYKCVYGRGLGEKQIDFVVQIMTPGHWSEWSPWSPCSVSCDAGEKMRSRTCEGEAANLKLDETTCIGESKEIKSCFVPCRKREWGTWSSCSATCGFGFRKRCRLIDAGKASGDEVEECEEEECKLKDCSMPGQWLEWSSWSACTSSGTTQRSRKCKSSFPDGEKECIGHSTETKFCRENNCRAPGTWQSWSAWSPCSQTCGHGHQKRTRKCNPSKCGRSCRGADKQVRKCFLQYCSNKTFPSLANIQVKGHLNGRPLDEKIDVAIENSDDNRQITSNLNPSLHDQNWFPYTPFLFSPLSWNMAYELDNADNGLSLTDGNFRSESDIQFSTGEGLRVKHRGDGFNGNGTFLVEIEVVGEVPLVKPHATVVIDPIEQNLVQTGPRELYAFTQNNVTIADRDLSYSWNNSIQYDAPRERMQYLVEKLTMKNLTNAYDLKNKKVKFTASASIGKKFQEDKCPPGFRENIKFMHCEDINECEMSLPACETDRICENTFGSYKCSCRSGFKMAEGRCLDVDECSQSYAVCSHFCHNTPGSYVCSCPYGYYLDRDRRNCKDMSNALDFDRFVQKTPKFGKTSTSIDDYSDADYDRYEEHQAVSRVSCPPGYFYKNKACKDYNECENFQSICDIDETCVNVPGSFQCISTPCPAGYDRIKSNRNCVKICSTENKCQRGAIVSESVIYYPAALSHANILPLDKIGQPECNVVKTRYKITDSAKLFQVRNSENRHFLFPVVKLNRNTLYRVEVEAFSYGPKNELLYFNKLIIFLIMN